MRAIDIAQTMVGGVVVTLATEESSGQVQENDFSLIAAKKRWRCTFGPTIEFRKRRKARGALLFTDYVHENRDSIEDPVAFDSLCRMSHILRIMVSSCVSSMTESQTNSHGLAKIEASSFSRKTQIGRLITLVSIMPYEACHVSYRQPNQHGNLEFHKRIGTSAFLPNLRISSTVIQSMHDTLSPMCSQPVRKQLIIVFFLVLFPLPVLDSDHFYLGSCGNFCSVTAVPSLCLVLVGDSQSIQHIGKFTVFLARVCGRPLSKCVLSFLIVPLSTRDVSLISSCLNRG